MEKKLLYLIKDSGWKSLNELSETVGVSPQTIRNRWKSGQRKEIKALIIGGLTIKAVRLQYEN